MEDLTREGTCIGRSCSYNIADDSANCSSGVGHCFAGIMVRAHESGFHDAKLMKATEAINEILASIADDEKGRELSFLATPWGAFLAWVDHGAGASDDAIGYSSDPTELAAALKVKESAATAAD